MIVREGTVLQGPRGVLQGPRGGQREIVGFVGSVG